MLDLLERYIFWYYINIIEKKIDAKETKFH